MERILYGILGCVLVVLIEVALYLIFRKKGE